MYECEHLSMTFSFSYDIDIFLNIYMFDFKVQNMFDFNRKLDSFPTPQRRTMTYMAKLLGSRMPFSKSKASQNCFEVKVTYPPTSILHFTFPKSGDSTVPLPCAISKTVPKNGEINTTTQRLSLQGLCLGISAKQQASQQI